MQSDRRLVSQLEEAVGSAQKALEETKHRHKARVSALRAEQRREVEQIQASGSGVRKSPQGRFKEQRLERGATGGEKASDSGLGYDTKCSSSSCTRRCGGADICREPNLAALPPLNDTGGL